jgi:hemerythrin-like domain-containing protein
MKPAIQELMQEHQLILRMLGALDGLCAALAEGRNVPQQDLDDVVDFLRRFADRCHHGKEEELLFPAMEKAGIPREQGPIGVMLADHERGRALTAELAEAARRRSAGESAAADAFRSAASAYSYLLVQHIGKEDHCLYPMALGEIQDADWESLSAQFSAVEEKTMGPEARRAFVALAERLEQAYAKRPASR